MADLNESKKLKDNKVAVSTHFLADPDPSTSNVVGVRAVVKGSREVMTVDRGVQTDLQYNEVGLLNCLYCDKTYKSSKALAVHFKAIHDENYVMQCKVCNKIFRRAWSLKNHQRLHEPYKSFQCRICGKTYAQKNSMYYHFKAVHAGITYQCNRCPAEFRTKYFVKKHLRLVHNVQN